MANSDLEVGITLLREHLFKVGSPYQKPVLLGTKKEGGRRFEESDIGNFLDYLKTRTEGNQMVVIGYNQENEKYRWSMQSETGVKSDITLSKTAVFERTGRDLERYLINQEYQRVSQPAINVRPVSATARDGLAFSQYEPAPENAPSEIIMQIGGREVQVRPPTPAGAVAEPIYNSIEGSDELKERMGARNAPIVSPDTSLPVAPEIKKEILSTEVKRTLGENYDVVPRAKFKEVEDAFFKSRKQVRELEEKLRAYGSSTPAEVVKVDSERIKLGERLAEYNGITPDEVKLLKDGAAEKERRLHTLEEQLAASGKELEKLSLLQTQLQELKAEYKKYLFDNQIDLELHQEKNSQISRLSQRYKDLGDRAKGLDQNLRQAQSNYQSRGKEIEGLTAAKDDLSRQLDGRGKELADLCARLSESDQTIVKHAVEYNNRIKELERELQAARAENSSKVLSESTLGLKLEELKIKYAELERCYQDFKEQKQDELAGKDKTIATREGQCSLLEVHKDDLDQCLQQKQSEYKLLEQRNSELGTANDTLRQDQGIREQRVRELTQQLGEQTARVAELYPYEQRAGKLGEELETLKVENRRLTNEVSRAGQIEISGRTLAEYLALEQRIEELGAQNNCLLQSEADATEYVNAKDRIQHKGKELDRAKRDARKSKRWGDVLSYVGAAFTLVALAIGYDLVSSRHGLVTKYETALEQRDVQIQVLTEEQERELSTVREEAEKQLAGFNTKKAVYEGEKRILEDSLDQTSARLRECSESNESLNLGVAECSTNLSEFQEACNQRVSEAVTDSERKAAELQGSLNQCTETQDQTTQTLEQQCNDRLKQSTEELKKKVGDQEKALDAFRKTCDTPAI